MNSLRSRLLLLVGLALLPAIAAALFTGYQNRQQTIGAAQANQRQVAQLAAANQSQVIQAAHQLLKDLSDDAGLFGTAKQCSELMRSTQLNNPELANLGLIALNGDVICSAVDATGITNVADRPHFKEAIASKRFVVGQYAFGRISQKHAIVLTYPILESSGTVRAALFSSLDLTRLSNTVNNIDLPPGAILETVDSSGTVVSRRPESELWLGKPTGQQILPAFDNPTKRSQTLVDDDGVERLNAFENVGLPGQTHLVLRIAVPISQIVGPAVREQKRTATILALTSALALLAAWFVARYLIGDRVDVLMATAREIAAGNYGARTGIAPAKDELSRLAHAIDDMGQSLVEQAYERTQAEKFVQLANNELVVNARQKDEFLAMLAHELRNPLAPIRSAAHLLTLRSDCGPHALKAGNIIGRQVNHMAKLVDDLLDVSRVTYGAVKLDMQSVDLNLIVAMAVEQVLPEIESRRHRLRVAVHDSPATTHGDATRLVQVVANILSNGCKYTPEHGNLDVAVRAAGRTWEIRIKDDGIGIDAALLPQVFDLFSQGERALARSQGGLGLGLHLARKLVERHGGRIDAGSEGEGKGSTFVISLPMAAIGSGASPPSPEPGAAAPPEAKAPVRVLVVDDVEDVADTTAMLLEASGFEVAVAYTGADALVRAASFEPQVCILDIGMPVMDGYELVRQLRALPQTRHSTMIALTGYGQASDKARAMACGFDHHFAKPVSPPELLQVLEETGKSDEPPVSYAVAAAAAAGVSPGTPGAAGLQRPGATRQTALPTSSATSSAPFASSATPTGRP